MRGFPTRCGQRIVDAWLVYQVELHGQYSTARLRAFRNYAQSTSLPRIAAICLGTPVLSLALIVLVDCVPLAPPDAGTSANYVFWCRNLLTVAFMTYGPIEQFQQLTRQSMFTSLRVVAIAVVASVVGVGFQYLLSLAIGFPLPFSLALGLPAWALIIFLFIALYHGTATSRDRTSTSSSNSARSFWREIWNYVLVFTCQASLVFIFPAYIYGFQSISASAQTGFVLLLPLIKIVMKNWLCYLLGDLDDIKPEFVIFNIEIFNAIYVSCCMQSSSSITTTITLTLVDWVQGLQSIRDVNEMLADIRQLAGKIPPGSPWYGKSCVEVALLILDVDPKVRAHPSLTDLGAIRNGDVRLGSSFLITKKRAKRNTIVPMKRVESGSPCLSSVFPTAAAAVKENGSNAITCTSTGTLDVVPKFNKPLDIFDEVERLLFVQKTTQLLFTTEFVILVEFTEVIVPVVYSMYIVAVYHLPNRTYYPQLAEMDELHLRNTVANVLLYAGLELISFLVMTWFLQRRLGIATLRQLGFVLDTQWTMVQSKLLLWIFYAVQNSLFHFGADFSFQFTWLRKRS